MCSLGQLLDNLEQGRPLDFRPTVVAVTAEPPKDIILG